MHEKWQSSEDQAPRRRGIAALRGPKVALIVSTLVFICILVAMTGGEPFSSGGLSQAAAVVPGAQGGDGGFDRYVDFSLLTDRSHPKLDAPLTEMAQVADAEPGQVAALAQARDLRLEEGQVQVQLKVRPGAEAAVSAAVSAVGGRVTSDYQSLLQAWLPPGQITSLAERADVYRIQSPRRLIELESLNQSYVTTEGLFALNGDAWHAAGRTGVGVRIALIDGSFGGYQTVLRNSSPSCGFW